MGSTANAGELEKRQQALDESVITFKTLVKPLEAEMGVRVAEVLEDSDYCYLIDNESTAEQCGVLAEKVEIAALDLQIAQEKTDIKTAETRLESKKQELEVANTVLKALRRITKEP